MERDDWMDQDFMVPNSFEEEEDEIERDMMYMRRLYPSICKEIAEYMEEECDKMEYEGSPMFDQYPDKETILKMVDRIYDKISYRMKDMKDMKDTVSAQDTCCQNPFRDLIQVMMCNEYHCRRRRYHRRRRMFY